MGQHGDPPAGARVAEGGALPPVCLRVDETAVPVRPAARGRTRSGTCTVDVDGIDTSSPPPLKPMCTRSRIAVGMVLLMVVGLCIADLATSRYAFVAVEAAAEWLQNAGPIALLGFSLLYAVVVVSLLPAMVLTVTGGYIFSQTYGTFGIVLSAMSSLLGSSVGAVTALLLGRYVLQGVAERLVSKFQILNALDDVLAEHGFEVVALLRMSPVIPNNIFNYIMGATRVKPKDFFFGSIGMVPSTVLWTVFGSMIHNIKQAMTGEYQATPMHWAFLVFGLVATVAVVGLTARLTSNKLNQMAAAKRDEEAGRLAHAQLGHKPGHGHHHHHHQHAPALGGKPVPPPPLNTAVHGSGPGFLPTTTPRLRTSQSDRRADTGGYSVLYV